VRKLLGLTLCGCLTAILGCSSGTSTTQQAPGPQPTKEDTKPPKGKKTQPVVSEDKKIEVEPNRVEVSKGSTAKIVLVVKRKGGYSGPVTIEFESDEAKGIKIDKVVAPAFTQADPAKPQVVEGVVTADKDAKGGLFDVTAKGMGVEDYTARVTVEVK